MQVGSWNPNIMLGNSGTDSQDEILAGGCYCVSTLAGYLWINLGIFAKESVVNLLMVPVHVWYKIAALSPLEPLSNLARDQEGKLGMGGISRGLISSLSEISWNSVDHHPKSWTNTNLIQHESSLFSSSLSEIFSRKHKISSLCILSLYVLDVFALFLSDFLKEDTLLDLMLDGWLDHEEEPLESLQEIEVQAIGSLLPDEDDLFSGVMGLDTPANRDDELEDFDLFSSGGGVESESDDRLGVGQGNLDIVGASNGSIVGGHPSRTLFVRNINSNVEDSELKALFEQYGDIRTLYRACKHRGFATISYYDIRAAQNATRALQNKPLRHRKLDIHYSIPKGNTSEKDVNQGTLVVFNLDASVSTNGLQQIFVVFGEIKIHEISPEQNHKFIEFYDVRAVEDALCALNRCDIGEKQIEIEPSPPGGVRWEIKLYAAFLFWAWMWKDQGQDESSNLCQSSLDDLMARRVAGVCASDYMDNGSSPILQDVIRSPVNTFIGPSQSSGVPINLPSLARVASVNNQFNLREPNHTLDVIKFQNQCITSFHPQSFPEYHDNSAKSLPSNSSSTIPDMVSSFVSPMTDGLDNRSIHGVSINGHSIEPNEGANEDERLHKMAANEEGRLQKMVANEEGRAAQLGSSKVQQAKLQNVDERKLK
ncbi:hypothetical protein SLEP1_g52633 [Rubroshorea leprosula]|uniref:RRM domain-containing protein n=1 Tax=Rubroshorea leprosula TaxID=152421 RepID=A0AAV5M6W6_9ROSI|nr:hypothetical protein SLEP1_g52633 [Rubroshorea leprosula]